MPLRWYESQDFKCLEQATSFGDLVEVGHAVLSRIHRPAVIVCGPITTGGFGHARLNRRVFNLAIELLIDQQDRLGSLGLAVFNQWPFEDAIIRLTAKAGGEGYCHDVIDVFYGGLFEHEQLQGGRFLPNWMTSTGASKERVKLLKLGKEVQPYPADLYERVLTELSLP